MKRIEFTLREAAAAAFVLAVLWTASPPAQAADASPEDLSSSWRSGRNWISIRAGYAKSMEVDAPHGSFGGGVGFNHMMSGMKIFKATLFKRWSMGGAVHVEHLGGFGASNVIEIPVTVELMRHFQLGSPYLRPYVGFGGGAYYRKLYRTGSDLSVTRPAWYLVLGANTPVDSRSVFGLDIRLIQLDTTNDPVNPVFGPGKDKAGQWSAKLSYALTY